MNKKEAEDIAYAIKDLIDGAYNGAYSVLEVVSPLMELGNMPKVLEELKWIYEEAEPEKLDFIKGYLYIDI